MTFPSRDHPPLYTHFGLLVEKERRMNLRDV